MGRLSVNEWLTFLVGVGSLVVSVFTYLNAADTRDIKGAVSKLAVLAEQTKRQADAQNGQLGVMRDQVAALKDQLLEAKAQTKAISAQTTKIGEQTEAIKASAASAVKSADMQGKTAEAQLKAAQQDEIAAKAAAQANLPQPNLFGLDISGLTEKPNNDGMVMVSIKPVFINSGGGSLIQGITIYKVILDDFLPAIPDYSNGLSFGGNEITVVHGGQFFPNVTQKVAFPVAKANDIAGGKRMFVLIGYVVYYDTTRQEHKWCYAYMVKMPKDEPVTWYNIPAPAYHCQS